MKKEIKTENTQKRKKEKKIRRAFFLVFIMIFMLTSVSYAYTNPMRLIGKYSAGQQRVVTLMYHRISENISDKNTYCITPADLEEDIAFLKNKGYVFAKASELYAVCRANSGKNVALLTFDDGYESDFKYVLPLLEKYNVKATFFVIGSKIGKPYYMNEEELKTLSASPFAEIGNHSYEIHSKTVNELVNLYSQYSTTENIILDFQKNKEVLEKIIEKSVVSLSYPNGIHTYYADNALKSRRICNTTLSVNEIQYVSFSGENQIIGRYNRSDKRKASDIENLLK